MRRGRSPPPLQEHAELISHDLEERPHKRSKTLREAGVLEYHFIRDAEGRVVDTTTHKTTLTSAADVDPEDFLAPSASPLPALLFPSTAAVVGPSSDSSHASLSASRLASPVLWAPRQDYKSAASEMLKGLDGTEGLARAAAASRGVSSNGGTGQTSSEAGTDPNKGKGGKEKLTKEQREAKKKEEKEKKEKEFHDSIAALSPDSKAKRARQRAWGDAKKDITIPSPSLLPSSPAPPHPSLPFTSPHLPPCFSRAPSQK